MHGECGTLALARNHWINRQRNSPHSCDGELMKIQQPVQIRKFVSDRRGGLPLMELPTGTRGRLVAGEI
jgi:hypothetical protein